MKNRLSYVFMSLLVTVTLLLLFASCSHEHSYGEWTVEKEATCAEEGTRIRICKCGESEIETIPLIDHIPGDWINDSDATCIEDGSKHQICSVCDATINTEIIVANGHAYGNWIIDNEATCTDDGSKHHVCAVCQETQNQIINKLGHEKTVLNSAEKINEKFYANWKCGRCDNCFMSEYEPLSAEISGKSIDYGYGVPMYSWDVIPNGGVGDYSFAYFVYETWSGRVIVCSGNDLLPGDRCIHLDTNSHSVYSKTLSARVFVYDSVGTITYDFYLNDGTFGILDTWIVNNYVLTHIDNDANNAYR